MFLRQLYLVNVHCSYHCFCISVAINRPRGVLNGSGRKCQLGPCKLMDGICFDNLYTCLALTATNAPGSWWIAWNSRWWWPSLPITPHMSYSPPPYRHSAPPAFITWVRSQHPPTQRNIWGAADEAVLMLNNVHKPAPPPTPPLTHNLCDFLLFKDSGGCWKSSNDN